MTDRDLATLLDPLLGRLAALIAERLAANGNGREPDATEPDRLLTPKEAADRLGVSVRYLYGHLAKFPFAVRLPGRSVRFSARGLGKYIERRTS